MKIFRQYVVSIQTNIFLLQQNTMKIFRQILCVRPAAVAHAHHCPDFTSLYVWGLSDDDINDDGDYDDGDYDDGDDDDGDYDDGDE